MRRTQGRPPLAVVAREGDPRGAIAVAVMTEGIAHERGAEVPVALAARAEARLEKAASVVPSGDGFRARGLATTEAEAAALVRTFEAALLTPVGATDLPAVHRKLALLARRPLGDPALEAAVRCEARVVAPASARGAASSPAESPGDPTIETLEG